MKTENLGRREKGQTIGEGNKYPNKPQPAPTVSIVGPRPTIIQIGRPTLKIT